MSQEIANRFKNVSRSKTFRNILRLFDLDKKAVLDIGCSYGEFLIHFGKGSAGITIIPEEVSYGTSLGLDVRLGNIEADDFVLSEKFDAIFSNNLLEHLYSPHNFLIKIKSYLKSEGNLILGVPCVPKIASLSRLKKFRGSLASAHINFFTQATLLTTVERAGWKVRVIRGFHFGNKTLDKLFDPIYPHFYVVAMPDPDFKYAEKRARELKGYNQILCG